MHTGGAIVLSQWEQEDKRHQDAVEDSGSEIYLSIYSSRICNTNDQGNVDEDDDDEEPRPAKQRKCDLVYPTFAYQTLTIFVSKSLKLFFR